MKASPPRIAYISCTHPHSSQSSYRPHLVSTVHVQLRRQSRAHRCRAGLLSRTSKTPRTTRTVSSRRSPIYWFVACSLLPYQDTYRYHSPAAILQEAGAIAPKSLMTQVIRDASHTTDALKEAMSTNITDSPPSPAVPYPEIKPTSPTSPIQRFLSMTRSTKAKGPWKDPEVCNKHLSID